MSALSARDDPTGKARKLLPDWVVTEQLPVFAQHGDGRILPCSYYRLRRGDFVDVIATVDIVQRPGKRDLSVGLTLCQVVHLRQGAISLQVSLRCLLSYVNLDKCTQPLKDSTSQAPSAKLPKQVVRVPGAFVQGNST